MIKNRTNRCVDANKRLLCTNRHILLNVTFNSKNRVNKISKNIYVIYFVYIDYIIALEHSSRICECPDNVPWIVEMKYVNLAVIVAAVTRAWVSLNVTISSI